MHDFALLRRLVIVSIFTDDDLMGRVVLKGGNALSLVYGIGKRSSLDVDFSLPSDFHDMAQTERRLVAALTDRFDSAGYRVFDARLVSKPADPRGRPPAWGGYTLEFKLISQLLAGRLRKLEDIRRQAEVTGPAQQRILRVEFSKYEFCGEKIEVEFDGYTIYVYPLDLIALEKLRAICQQMPEYPFVRNKRARARDFYDIYCICVEGLVDLGSARAHTLIRQVFAAKAVPLQLVSRIANYREFHRLDWPSVVDSVSGRVADFDFYFEWLIREIEKLEPLGKE